MIQAVCRDYGFDCDFTADGDIETVIDQFMKHVADKHGIEYQRESVTKYLFIQNKCSH